MESTLGLWFHLLRVLVEQSPWPLKDFFKLTIMASPSNYKDFFKLKIMASPSKYFFFCASPWGSSLLMVKR
ncbi:hypothetical protein AMTR_s00069p00164760 [Amborella trichopoda]|uniref:Uncharacterized protein n=1 Tax=Amborella trichopoda TaxID=13333 RepID=U5D1A8_AMBTC|nr:hypothetical protein AMTR_s00069p00164760 [Amborella trichopoda]